MAITNVNSDHRLNPDGLLYIIQRLKSALDKKVDTKTGYSLISDLEITRLASVTNYDDTDVQSAISSLQSKVEALEAGTYDDTEVRGLIASCQSDIATLQTKVANWDDAYTHSQTAHAPSNAQENVIETVKVNGIALTPTDKSVDVTVPTKVSDLTNDSGYLTDVPSEYVTDTELTAKGYAVASDVYAKTETYNKTEIDTKLKGGVHAKGSVNTYAELPSSPEDGDMYNIITADEEHNIKAGDNVVWLADENRWDNYGGIVDTSGLVAKTDVLTNEEIETIWTTVMG